MDAFGLIRHSALGVGSVNERVRHKLCEIIGRYGRDICREPQRCKGLLLDHCAGDRREVFVLVSALEEQVVGDLLEGLGGGSWGMVSSRLVDRLVETRALAEDAALWAVESWALALGVISNAERTAALPARQAHTTKRRPAAKEPRSPGTPTPSTAGLLPVSVSDVITTRVAEIRLKRIPDGEFWMGSPDSDPEACDDEKSRHEVEIRQAFYLGVTPVTQAQFAEVMGKDPSHFKDQPANPVERVTWYDAVAFCNKLSRAEALPPYYLVAGAKRVQVRGGLGFRLPTEAEWEYACRAGTETRYSFGDDATLLDRLGWYASNSVGRTHPVGQKSPNAFGLYDMHGNLWEWCWDGYDRFYYQHSLDDDELSMETAAYRVVRGGSWNDLAPEVRSASRYKLSPEVRFNFVGFRVARGIPSP